MSLADFLFSAITAMSASLYAAIPLSGALIALFTVEQLVNGIRNGFDHPEPPEIDRDIPPVDTTAPTGARP